MTPTQPRTKAGQEFLSWWQGREYVTVMLDFATDQVARIEEEAVSEYREVLNDLAARHDWQPGFGQCICEPHLKARSLLQADQPSGEEPKDG